MIRSIFHLIGKHLDTPESMPDPEKRKAKKNPHYIAVSGKSPYVKTTAPSAFDPKGRLMPRRARRALGLA